MKIPIHYSLEVARKIANKISLPHKTAKYCTLSSWSNGREQGLCISLLKLGDTGLFSRKIVFAQQRNSDNILIVKGTNYDFDIQTNQPTEELWNKEGARVEFKHNEINKAVKYITDFLVS